MTSWVFQIQKMAFVFISRVFPCFSFTLFLDVLYFSEVCFCFIHYLVLSVNNLALLPFSFQRTSFLAHFAEISFFSILYLCKNNSRFSFTFCHFLFINSASFDFLHNNSLNTFLCGFFFFFAFLMKNHIKNKVKNMN